MTAKEHVPLAKKESNETHKDSMLVDGDVCEKWSMPKSTCVHRSNYEKKFESIDNNTHRSRFETFIEDEEIEDESTETFDVVHEKYLEVEMCNERSKEELKSSNDEVIK